MTHLERAAVARGAGFAMFLVVPGALVEAVVSGHKAGAAVAVGFLLILVGFALGGFVAAKSSDTLPLKHAAAAAALAFVVVQGVAAVELIVRGKGVAVPGIVVSLLLAACIGMVGGMIAIRGPGRAGGARP